MKKNEFRFMERLRVRWSEIDPQKIVFNGHYLMYFDTAMSGYWRALALPYADTMQRLGGDLFMHKASVEYMGTARYDEVLDVGIRCEKVTESSITFACKVTHLDQVVVKGELIYTFVEPDSHVAKPVPQVLGELLASFEAGKPMVQVRISDWTALGDDARGIRTSVFVQEQGIPAEREWDDLDPGCVHAVAYNHFGVPLATGRLVQPDSGIAKIGRMAVSQSMRGSGVGRAVLDALMATAKERGCSEVMLHAQTSAAPFYSRAGFVQRGAMFEEEGIPHIEMRRNL